MVTESNEAYASEGTKTELLYAIKASLDDKLTAEHFTTIGLHWS
jgi:hypothetical protein